MPRHKTVKLPQITNISDTSEKSECDLESLVKCLKEYLETKNAQIAKPKDKRTASTHHNIYDVLAKILDLIQDDVNNKPNAIFEQQKEQTVNIIAKGNVIVNAVAEQDIDIETLQHGRNMSNVRMRADGGVCVLGANNQVKVLTRINKKFEGPDVRELGRAFALLRGEILALGVPEKVTNRASRAVEDAEDEVSDNSPEPNAIVDSLCRAKYILETFGQVYDETKSWGKRLHDLVNILKKFIPTIAPLLAALSD